MNKKIMLFTIFVVGSLIFLSSSAHGQARKTVDFKIKGIGLESKYATVVRQLGPPVRKKRIRAVEDDCSGAKFNMELDYNGLKIYLDDGWKGGAFSVNGIEISSAKWIAELGIFAGASMNQVRAKFGNPGPTEAYDGFQIIGYSLKEEDAGVSFYFKAGKLAKVDMGQHRC